MNETHTHECHRLSGFLSNINFHIRFILSFHSLEISVFVSLINVLCIMIDVRAKHFDCDIFFAFSVFLVSVFYNLDLAFDFFFDNRKKGRNIS